MTNFHDYCDLVRQDLAVRGVPPHAITRAELLDAYERGETPSETAESFADYLDALAGRG